MKIRRKLIDCAQNWYTEVFEVADQDFDIRLPKFKMADAIWRLKIGKQLRNLNTGAFEITDHNHAIKLSKFQMEAKSSREA